MAQITILGLGPGEWNHLTLEAVAALNSHNELWLRTRHHPLVAEMPAHLAIHSFDEWYDEADDFASLYQRIAEEIVRLGQRGEGVLYAVPGHPWVGETTVKLVHALARSIGTPLRVLDGLSFIEPALSAVGSDALDGLQIADATAVAARHYPPFDGDRPVLIAQLYSRLVASDVKLTLMELYPHDHPVTLLSAAGTTRARSLTFPLYRLDQQVEFGDLATLWVPPFGRPSSLPHFLDIVAHLRAPEGCPWDREQDHHSLRNHILEEGYEVAEAIDEDNPGELRDELGDLLMLITLHAQIASESGDFNMSDVLARVSEKMVRRHPHVFGTTEVAGTEEVLVNWEVIKATERAEQGENRPRDAFDEVPRALPGLLRAQKVTKRAGKQGWTAPDPQAAWQQWQQSPEDDAALGDLLLALAAHAQQQGQDAETLLRDATARLITQQRP